jgi:ABC-type multidrug transport system fused ATPase/permease subunit
VIHQLRTVRQLIHGPLAGWMTFAVLGSVVIAGLDMLGVAAMLPLMQLIAGSDPEAGALGLVARTTGTQETRTLIIVVGGAIALTFSLKGLASVAFRWWLLGRTTSLEARASAEMLGRYVAAPYWAHRQREVSVVNRSIGQSVSQTFSQVVLGLLSLMADLLTLVAVTAVLILVSPVATVFIAALFVLIAWGLQRVLRRRQQSVGLTMAETDLDAWNSFIPAILGFREARLQSSAEVFLERYRRARGRRAEAQRQQAIISELPKHILEIGFVAGIVGVTILLFATETPESALATLGVFAAAAFRILPTLNRAGATVGGIRTGSVGLGLLVKEIEELNSHGYYRQTLPPPQPAFDGDIVFRDVSYNYSDSVHHVLSKVDIVIEEGKSTAIVGSSGAGKTTLLDLLLGLLEPTSGTIVCGGKDILTDLPGWYAGLGVVPQDVFVIDDSLASNVTYGAPDADRDRVLESIELAELNTLAASLPDGMETRLGERGVRLSGGQRQRVGIARALYRQPRIMVLDEATSSLDNSTERRISETIDKLRGSMTVVIVAHRLSTVRNADKIVFLSGGRVVSEGTFDEVCLDNSEFAGLVALGKLG